MYIHVCKRTTKEKNVNDVCIGVRSSIHGKNHVYRRERKYRYSVHYLHHVFHDFHWKWMAVVFSSFLIITAVTYFLMFHVLYLLESVASFMDSRTGKFFMFHYIVVMCNMFVLYVIFINMLHIVF